MFLYTPAYSTAYSSKRKKTKKKQKMDVEVLARRVLVHLSTKRTVQATQGVYATYSK